MDETYSGSASETVGNTVGVLVDHNTGFEAAIALGAGEVPDEHPHAP